MESQRGQRQTVSILLWPLNVRMLTFNTLISKNIYHVHTHTHTHTHNQNKKEENKRTKDKFVCVPRELGQKASTDV